jgi:hypothetical protein
MHASPVAPVSSLGEAFPVSEQPAEPTEVAIGLALAGAHAGAAVARFLLLPVRLAARAPVAGHMIHRAAADLAADGRRAETWARAQLEQLAEEILATPEVERALDRVLAGPLTDAVARSLAEHRVAERVAVQVLAAADLDRLIEAVLEHELTERALDRALASPGLERLLVQVLESRLVDGLTARVIESPEMDRVVAHVASSPELLDAITHQTQSLAEEMVADVRRRSQTVDDVAERTVRGWLRRPRPSTP